MTEPEIVRLKTLGDVVTLIDARKQTARDAGDLITVGAMLDLRRDVLKLSGSQQLPSVGHGEEAAPA